MADLTQDAALRIPAESTTQKWALDTSGAQTVYKGQPMIIDQNVDTVNITPYVDSLTVAATDVFVGIAATGKTTASGDDETIQASGVVLYTEPTIVGFVSTVFTNADTGKTIYMSDSGVLSVTAADNPQIGKLDRVEGGYAFVRLISPQVCTGA